MKYKILLFVALAGGVSSAFAQSNTTATQTDAKTAAQTPNPEPAYKRFPTIPPFNLLKIDSAQLTREDLKKHEPTIIMFFSPSCEHCQHQMDDMVAHMDELKKYQIVMATYQPFEEMVDFYKKYKIGDYKNIHLGRDTKFVLPPFYKIRSLPFMALYNKKGDLVTTFEGTTPVDKLLDAFKED